MNVHSRTGSGDHSSRELILAIPLLLFVGGCIVAALGIPAWQAYEWLRDGIWHPVSLIDVLQVLASFFAAAGTTPSDFQSWLHSPGTWLGLHKLLSVLHPSAGFWVASLGGVYLMNEANTHLPRQV